MNKKIICAYLWQEVIRLGFHPSGEKEQKKWVHQYLKSLNDFLEIGSFPNTQLGSISPIICKFSIRLSIDLEIECSITKTDKFIASFLFLPPAHNWELMWNHDVDGKFFTFPVQDILTLFKQRGSVPGKVSDENIKEVLDGLIFHPAAHQHIKSPIDKHEIRIGGGIGNAFLFLFHLRYQFCPIEEKRKAEEKRLIRLFADAVRENSLLTTSQLMAQP